MLALGCVNLKSSVFLIKGKGIFLLVLSNFLF